MLTIVNRMKPGLPKITLLIFIGISILTPLASGEASQITDIRFWSAPDHTRVVVDLTEPIQYEGSSQENPPLLTMELKGSLKTPRREVVVNDLFLIKVILTEPKKNTVKIVFHEKKPLHANVFLLKPYQDKPHRLVIDLVDIALEKKEQEERQYQKEVKPKGMKTVVIDPGHGGEDPGAIGARKTMEKDVVLKIGEKVLYHLGRHKEIKTFLTRKGDYFVPLGDRVKMAREYGADLFLSLHADGSFNPQIRGSSVYCLSLSGATDQAAKILADKENLSDILGGSFLKPTDLSKNPDLNQILFDLKQNDTMRESFRFAELILTNIKTIHPIKFPSYRQANFVVLRAPDIPSVLTETAFITNREDERLLKRDDFQEMVARSLSATIRKFFDGSGS
jgi:N-acetylmuramoyl-L-alanine amidase